MKIKFEKWQANQNDFIIISLKRTNDYILTTLQKNASQLCARRSGIGADTILVLQYDDIEKNINELVIINNDGTIAENCGNGLLCVSTYLRNIHESLRTNEYESFDFFEITIAEEQKILRPTSVTGSNTQLFDSNFSAVTMGGTLINTRNSWHLEVIEETNKLIQKYAVEYKVESLNTINIGNPHIVIEFDKIPDEIFDTIGKELQRVKNNTGINVHFIEQSQINSKLNKEIKQRHSMEINEAYKAISFERGVGRTNACGSGACAIASAILANELSDREQWMLIDMLGGKLLVKQRSPNDDCFLYGESSFIYSAEINI